MNAVCGLLLFFHEISPVLGDACWTHTEVYSSDIFMIIVGRRKRRRPLIIIHYYLINKERSLCACLRQCHE